MTRVILRVAPSLGNVEDIARRRPIGRDAEAYRQMLDGLVELAVAADDLGYWGLAHTEEHLHSEGVDVSPAPLMLNLYLGQHTRSLHHGQLGLVLPSHDPVRLAAETSVADHMLDGRFFVGLSRGHESRWTNIVCQKYGVTATRSDGSEADVRNHLLFDENFKVLTLAWERDLFSYDGPTYQVPYPHAGIPDWPAGGFTARYGAAGEVDADGVVRGVSVVPKPRSTPRPAVFKVCRASSGSVAWCGEQSVVPVVVNAPDETLPGLAEAHAAEAGAGARFGVTRMVSLVDDQGGRRGDESAQAEVIERFDRYESPVWDGWYARFNGAVGEIRGRSTAERLLESGLLLGGTVEMVKRRLERLLQAAPCDYLVWQLNWGVAQRDDTLRSLELFATQVLSALGMEAPERVSD